jgi:hypothetical protein
MSPFDELWLCSFGNQTELFSLDKMELAATIQNVVTIMLNTY